MWRQEDQEGVQDHPQLHSNFEASLCSLRQTDRQRDIQRDIQTDTDRDTEKENMSKVFSGPLHGHFHMMDKWECLHHFSLLSWLLLIAHD